MAGKVRYLIERQGRYHARIVVPERLRPIIKKKELSVALGADRREALRRLPRAVAGFQEQLAEAESRSRASVPASVIDAASFDVLKAARARYDSSIAFDGELRDATPLYARIGYPDEDYIEDLKSIVAGRLEEQEMPRPFLFNIRQHLPADLDRAMWRRATRLLAQAELAAIEVTSLRNEGEPDPPLPDFLQVPANTVAPSAAIEDVFRGYRAELQRAGRGRDAESRWAPIVDSLIKFIGHNSAGLITRRDAIRWKDHLLASLSGKTVRDAYLATVKAAFSWGADNLDIAQNPFAGVKVRLAKKVVTRERGFQLDEAEAVLKAARSYSGSSKEHAEMTAAKRWVPFLCAYTGARVAELTQLRAEDVRCDDAIHYIRITPAAGTVKSGIYRDVPLHDHLIAEGFLNFVKERKSGPLFYRNTLRRGATPPAEIVATRLAKWVRALGVIGEEVQPNHGWRHRLKTVGRELKVDSRVLDAIQGHAARTAGEHYGDVSLKAKHDAIKTLPRYRSD